MGNGITLASGAKIAKDFCAKNPHVTIAAAMSCLCKAGLNGDVPTLKAKGSRRSYHYERVMAFLEEKYKNKKPMPTQAPDSEYVGLIAFSQDICDMYGKAAKTIRNHIKKGRKAGAIRERIIPPTPNCHSVFIHRGDAIKYLDDKFGAIKEALGLELQFEEQSPSPKESLTATIGQLAADIADIRAKVTALYQQLG